MYEVMLQIPYPAYIWKYWKVHIDLGMCMSCVYRRPFLRSRSQGQQT